MYPQWAPPPPWPPRQPGPSVGWAVALWIVMAGCLVGTLVCAGMAAVGLSYDARLDNGETTTATVIDADDTSVTVKFHTAANEPITTDFIWWPDNMPDVGDRVEITYDPSDPYYAVAAGSNEDQILAMVFGGAAIVALGCAVAAGVGAMLVHRARGKAARAPGWPY